jgi:hypothetical protein
MKRRADLHSGTKNHILKPPQYGVKIIYNPPLQFNLEHSDFKLACFFKKIMKKVLRLVSMPALYCSLKRPISNN